MSVGRQLPNFAPRIFPHAEALHLDVVASNHFYVGPLAATLRLEGEVGPQLFIVVEFELDVRQELLRLVVRVADQADEPLQAEADAVERVREGQDGGLGVAAGRTPVLQCPSRVDDLLQTRLEVGVHLALGQREVVPEVLPAEVREGHAVAGEVVRHSHQDAFSQG